MFANSYQNGSYFEIFDPKDALNKANKEKEKFYQALYKVSSASFEKQFDKTLKNYIFELQGHNTKFILPKEGELGLIQQYLVLQLNVPQTNQWSIEISLTDTARTKRHVYITQNCKQIEKKPFHVRYPFDIPRNVWINLFIDLYSFMHAWKGQTFRSLDLIQIIAPCRLRKIFSTKSLEEVIPKQMAYPIGFQHENVIISYIDNVEASIDSIQMKVTSKKVTGFSQQSSNNKQQKQKLGEDKTIKSNIVFDDHPTPKKKTQPQSQQISSKKQDESIEQSNEFLQIKSKAPMAKTDNIRKNNIPREKSVQRKYTQQQTRLRLANSVPKKQVQQQKSKEEDEYYIRTQKFTNDQFQQQSLQNYGDEIEEDIEVQEQIDQVQIAEDSQKKIITANNFNKRSISELKNDSKIIEDSLEAPFKNSMTTFMQEGFYANQLKKYTDLNRPFTPEYSVDFQFHQKQI